MSQPTILRRRELAAFLRSRRERVTPDMAGLPTGGRRRTPGLRREEVAQLANVGVTWYTWLEQARDIGVSSQVLAAIAHALLLDASERAHLFALAGLADPVAVEQQPAVSPGLHLTLRQLEPLPACVINGRYDILAYNCTFGRLVDDLDKHEPANRNVIWLALTDSAWRQALVDRDREIRQCIAQFRAAMAGHIHDPIWTNQLARFQHASAEFRQIWCERDVMAPYNHVARILNPDVGLLHLEHLSLWLNPRSDTRVAIHTPADTDTMSRLEQLHQQTARHSQ